MLDSLAARLLAIALSLPAPWASVESPIDRTGRLEMITRVIAEETATEPRWVWDNDDLAWAVLVSTYEESGRFRRDVHDGRFLGDGGRARCLGQVHAQPLIPWAEWVQSSGTSEAATRRCIRITARALAAAAARCVGSTRGLDRAGAARMFAAYGTGTSCDGSLPIARRRSRMWDFLTRMQRAQRVQQPTAANRRLPSPT